MPLSFSAVIDVAEERELERLSELGALLRSCRAIFMTMFEHGFHEPSTTQPSEAWADFQMLMAGPKGLWPNDFNRQPRSAAVKLLHQQADYCHAMGVLVAVPEVRDPIATLVRSVVEYGCRGFWILDPAADHRTRCIRTYLLELVSLLHAGSAYKLAPPGPARDAAKTNGKAQFRAAKTRAAEMFWPDGTKLADGPSKWTIEGHGYASWTTITEAWAAAHELGLDGAALYAVLAIGAHPQGFSATAGLSFDSDGHGTRVFTVDHVEKQVRLAIASFYYTLALVANYHGQRQALLVSWEDEMLRILPGAVEAKQQTP